MADLPGVAGGAEGFSRIRDFADAGLGFVVMAQGAALFLMWRRLGELVSRSENVHTQRVDDAKETTRSVLSALSSSREAIAAQAHATERLREAVERMREPMEGLRTNIELL